mgnify:CR=1 FL=1
MSLLVSCTILDGILAVSLSNSKPARQVGYVYSLCSADNTVICRQPQSSSPQSRFDLAALGCAGGGYYVEVAAAYRDGPEDAEVRESGKSSMVYYYLTRRLSYDDLEHASFPPGQLTLYEIEWDGVVFEFLLHPVPDSRQMVVFGNGNIRKDAQLPLFHRIGWYAQLPCTTLWYFDPSLYLGDARICWGYGTAQRWYLRDIAHIVEKIQRILGIQEEDVLFYGSSGGGFTSIMLACMLRGKAEVLNPQCYPAEYHPYLVEPMKRACLKDGETLERERLDPVALFRREGFVPHIYCTQNSGAEDDVYGQLLPFLEALKQSFPQLPSPVDVHYFFSENGHNSWPASSACIQDILDGLAGRAHTRSDRQRPGAGSAEGFSTVCTAGEHTVTAEIYDAAAKPSTRYACYLLDEKRQTLQKQMYQERPSFTFSVQPGVYSVRTFVRNWPEAGAPPVTLTQYSPQVCVSPVRVLDYGELDDADFHSEQPAFYQIHWGGVCFAFAVRAPRWADRAVVLGSGDMRQNGDGSRFHRLSWASEIPGCAIYYHDPTLAAGESTMDWGYGTNQRWYLENIAVLLKKILDRLGIALSDTLFFGSSGGGYMSILLASMLHARAAAINPQLILEHSYPSQVKLFQDSVLQPGERLIPLRTHALRLIEREDFFPPLRILQNRTASREIACQLTPFLNELPGLDAEQSDNLSVCFYDAGGGCGAMPPKADCLRLMAEELARPAPCLEKFGPYPPNALMARLEAGAFDSGAEKERTPDFSGPPIPQPIPAVAGGQIMTCAQELMAGKLWLYHRIEPMDYTLETLDFNTRFSRVPNSFQLYLQGLNPIQILTAAYQASGERAFLTYAGRFLEAWRQYAAGPDAARNHFVFQNAHAVSLRVENLMYFGQSCAQAGISVPGLYGLLLKHGAWLRDGGNYNGRHNYGIMQSLALLRLGYVLRRPEWVTRAKKRLFAQKKSSFDREYVHRENSPAYSDMVIDLFQRAGRCLDAHQDPAGQVLLDEMRRAYEFMRWAVKPDGTMAQIGDTPTAPPRASMDSALPPPEGRRLFLQSGYCFWRSAGGQSQDTWKMLKAGFDNKTHKHADDLSFMLYARGQDVFVDCGMYGYTNDGFRTYLCSANAHNTVVVDGGSYPLTPASMALVGVEQHRFLPACDWVTVFNRAYTGVCIRRRFLSSQDVTILIDWAESRAEHTYSQLFHLGELVEMVYASDNEVILRLEQSGCRVRLRQLGPPSQLSLIQGTTDRPGYGLLSRGENHLEACRSLKFDLTGTEGRWITIITIEAEDGSVLLQDGSRVPACEISYDQRKNATLLGHTIIPL